MIYIKKIRFFNLIFYLKEFYTLSLIKLTKMKYNFSSLSSLYYSVFWFLAASLKYNNTKVTQRSRSGIDVIGKIFIIITYIINYVTCLGDIRLWPSLNPTLATISYSLDHIHRRRIFLTLRGFKSWAIKLIFSAYVRW